MSDCTLKHYANEAKARMLRDGRFPPFIGKVPYKKYELLLKIEGSNETLCKMCKVIETGNELAPLTSLIDSKFFDSLTPAEQQRYIFRLAEVYRMVKMLYSEMEEKTSISL